MAYDPVYMQLIAVAKGTTVGGSIITSYARGCTLTRASTGVVSMTFDPATGGTDAATDSVLDPPTIFVSNVSGSAADTSATVKTFTFVTGGGTTAVETAFILKAYRLITR